MIVWKIECTLKDRTIEFVHTGSFKEWANANEYIMYDRIVAERKSI